jgi:hypothetical protein
VLPGISVSFRENAYRHFLIFFRIFPLATSKRMCGDQRSARPTKQAI